MLKTSNTSLLIMLLIGLYVDWPPSYYSDQLDEGKFCMKHNFFYHILHGCLYYQSMQQKLPRMIFENDFVMCLIMGALC